MNIRVASVVSSTFFRALCAGSLFFAAGTSYAAWLTTSIGYDPQGILDPRGLGEVTASQAGASSAAVNTSDLPANYSGAPHATYMNLEAFADANGAIGSDIGLRIGGAASARSVWSDSFVNTTGTAQNFQMSVRLKNMTFTTLAWPDWLPGNVFSVGFLADVLVNGVSVWQSGQIFSKDDNGYQINKIGFDIGTGNVEQSEAWSGTKHTYTLNDYSAWIGLGTFGAGETARVDYVLSSFASWNDANACAYECGEASAHVEDPFGISGGARIAAAGVGPIGDLPEPSGLALLGVGLLGLGWSRRSNRGCKKVGIEKRGE